MRSGGAGALALLGLLALASSSGSSPASSSGSSPASGSSPEGAEPSRYATSKLALLRGRYYGALGDALRDQLPRAPFGGAPVAALLAFTSIGGADERTSLGEIGEWQTPEAHWSALRTSALVRSLLGHDAAPVADWRGPSRVVDRCAVGLADLASERAELLLLLPELVPSDYGSPWAVALAFAAFSAGPAGAASGLRPIAAQLAEVPERRRVAAWLDALLARWRSGTVYEPPRRHPNAAYTALRTAQKLAAGELLQRRMGTLDGDPEWWAGAWPTRPGWERELVRAAWGERAA